MNTIFGPPTNLQITPDGKLALVANSMDWVADGAGWKPSPDNKLYVIDLTTDPPKLIDTVQVGKQPSGLSINRAGDLCLIANRADNSISVLQDRRQLGEADRHGGDGRAGRARGDSRRTASGRWPRSFPGHKIALLDIDGDKVTLQQAGRAGRPVAVQRRHRAGRQAGADRRQRRSPAPPTATSTRSA